jgi:anti-sigma regulatory factor (Ser/Thr protein kinase)
VPSLTLEPDLANVAEARHWVRGLVAELGLDDECEYEAQLVATELVTNAVLHGRTTLVIVVDHHDHVLRIEVEDGNPRIPVVLPPSTTATNGRGLSLVEQLSRRWGCDPLPDGKRVWAELPLLVDAVG